MGETLPLFESAGFAESEVGHPHLEGLKGQPAMGLVQTRQPARQQPYRQQPDQQPDHQQRDADRHMRVAWHLSNALKAGKAGRRSDGSKAKLTATQKRQVGNAICEHLLASLREQVTAENASPTQ